MFPNIDGSTSISGNDPAKERRLRAQVAGLRGQFQDALNNLAADGFFPKQKFQDGFGLGSLKLQCRRTLSGHLEGKVFAADWVGTANPDILVSVGQDGKLITWDANLGLKKKLMKSADFAMHASVEKTKGHAVALGQLGCSVAYYPKLLNEKNIDVIFDENPERHLFLFHAQYVPQTKFSPVDEAKLYTVSGDESICLIDVEQQVLERRFLGHNQDVMTIDVHKASPHVFVTGSLDTTCKLWDIREGSNSGAVMTFTGHEGDINSVKFFPDSLAFASGSEDKTTRLFSLTAYQEINQYRHPQYNNAIPQKLAGRQGSSGSTLDENFDDPARYAVDAVDFSLSGRVLFSNLSKKIYAWNTISEENEREEIGILDKSKLRHKGKVVALGVHPEGKCLFTASWDSTIKIWA